jgi:hypothetical protein
MGVLTVLLFLIAVTLICGIPGYVIGRRRGLMRPRVAFLPIVGFWIILYESIGRSSSWAALALIPYLGDLVLAVWTALEVPVRHERSRWWIAALVIPGVNLISYWVYAFTLPRQPAPAFEGAVA